MADELKVWVIQYHHRYGVDAWPWFGFRVPSEKEVIETLSDWEGEEADEWIEVIGPWDPPTPEECGLIRREEEQGTFMGWVPKKNCDHVDAEVEDEA